MKEFKLVLSNDEIENIKEMSEYLSVYDWDNEKEIIHCLESTLEYLERAIKGELKND